MAHCMDALKVRHGYVVVHQIGEVVVEWFQSDNGKRFWQSCTENDMDHIE